MSVRQDASTEGLTRTATLPSATAFTIAGWFRKRGVGDNSWEHVAGLLSSGGASWMILYSRVAGTNNFVIHGSSGDSSLALVPVTNTWYYIAIGSNGTGNGALTGWVITTAGVVYTASTFGFAMTPAEMSLLKSTGFGEWNNAAMAAVKVWNVKLTTAELQTQRVSLATVVQTGNIHLSSELRIHTNLTDNSGNGRNWTSMGGTLTSEEDPPGLYSGGTTFYSTPSGILLPSGVVIKSPRKVTIGSLAPSAVLRKFISRPLTGSLPFSAVLSRKASKVTSGNLGFSGVISSAIVKLKILAGSLSFDGTQIRKIVKNASSSVTPSGSLFRFTSYVRSLSGLLSPTGTLSKMSIRSMLGDLNLSGFVRRSINKIVSGNLEISGESLATRVSNTIVSVISGTLSISGTLTKHIGKSLFGNLTGFGDLTKHLRKLTAGILSSTGSLILDVVAATRVVVIDGTLFIYGSAAKTTKVVLGGVFFPQGLINKSIKRALGGNISFLGSLTRSTKKFLSASLAFIGQLFIGNSVTKTPRSRVHRIEKEARIYFVGEEVRHISIGEDK